MFLDRHRAGSQQMVLDEELLLIDFLLDKESEDGCDQARSLKALFILDSSLPTLLTFPSWKAAVNCSENVSISTGVDLQKSSQVVSIWGFGGDEPETKF